MGQSTYLVVAPRLTGGQLLDRMLDVEGRLRGLIRRVLSAERADWQISMVPESLRQQLLDILATNASHWRGWDEPDLLDCATLAQFIGILNVRWKWFSAIFPDKLRLTAKLEECREYRERLAHAEPLSANDKIKIFLLADELTNMIPGAQPTRAVAPPRATFPLGLNTRRVVWVDEHPEWTRMERRWFEELGADVTPVFSDEEAVDESKLQGEPHLVISDIVPEEWEDDTHLAVRFAAVDMQPPILYYVGWVDRGKPMPPGAVAMTGDPADLLREALVILKPAH
jgi:CheY-like chemotaxis protein